MSKRLCLGALVVIIVISRLPQLHSPLLLLDGDECILGLMAKHVAEGREFPVFFYGQPYGLALVEAPAGALSFLLLGVAAVPLKLAMLAIWTAGVLFYFLALARWMPTARALGVALLLVMMPAWAVSSMKAWSGYITAFSATGALLYVLARDPPGHRPWAIAGGLSAIIYFAHPLWLPGVVPIVLYRLVSARRPAPAFAYGCGIGSTTLAVVLLRLAQSTAPPSWSPPVLGNHDLVRSARSVGSQIYTNLTGSYYLHQSISAGTLTTVLANVWLGILAALLFLQIYRIVTKRLLLWSHLLFLGAIATIAANWVLLDGRDARYMLPLNALLVLAAGVELSEAADRSPAWNTGGTVFVATMLLFGAGSMNEFGRFSYMWWPATGRGEEKSLDLVIRDLASTGVHHVFSMNALLQWQIMFYSREAVVARWTSDVDRYPRYIEEVNRAMKDGSPTAIVGYTGFSGGLEHLVTDPGSIIDIDGKYFIYPRPDAGLLRRLRFRVP